MAFTEAERDRLYLRGLLPPAVLSQEVQAERVRGPAGGRQQGQACRGGPRAQALALWGARRHGTHGLACRGGLSAGSMFNAGGSSRFALLVGPRPSAGKLATRAGQLQSQWQPGCTCLAGACHS